MDIGVPRTRDRLGHHVVEHAEMGAFHGPSEAGSRRETGTSIYASEYIFSLSPPKKEGHLNDYKFTVHPTCQIQILQLP